MEEAGLKVSVDTVGSTFGRRDGQDNDRPTILVGPHLDTVNNGGNFDGTLGFVGGIEVMRTLNEKGLTTRHSITLAIFTSEEAFALGIPVWAARC